ncbi:Hsp70 family protein [Plantactinospora soyae]|uniref:Actin-like ATPase involved in cell morphogenesis n=1 Tax=Plantactinospora soyae TaxID=1544732 RepID=A0A927QXD3_9ACTN|nr:Hsp70 family protein [Plantactinospora soyae]MBE1485353.1 actin-like ATPase involved in cell morphogenesis [Plantactinospora soyae]
MGGAGARLGIDFGTSNTVAVLALPGREPRQMLFDGSPLLRSAVCVDTGERMLVGQDALHTSISFPQSFEPYPKRCVDDGTVLLGEREITIEDLFAAPLRRVATEARLTTGEPITEAVLTFPAAWGTHRRATLLAAAEQVLPTVRLVAEPVAAANFFVEVAGRQLPVGRCAVVYDFGAGTFDVTVVRRTGDGFEVLATEGLSDCGGLDIDAAIVERLGSTIGSGDESMWARLTSPVTASDRRASQQLWANARAGKEMLARTTRTVIHVPLFDVELPLGREELEELAEPIIARTVATTRTVLGRIEDAEQTLAAIFLSGGSSRMPAVASALHRALDITPSVVEQPELVVAEGSLRIPATATGSSAVPAAESTSVDAGGTAVIAGGTAVTAAGTAVIAGGTAVTAGGTDAPAGAWTTRLRSRPARVAGVAVAVVGILGAVAAIAALSGNDDRDQPGIGAAGAVASSSPTATPTPSVTPTVTASGVDSCMVGVWREVSDQSTIKINGRDVQFSGAGGTLQTYTAGGKVTLDFNKSKDPAATVSGVKWRQRTRGTASANVYHRNGIEYVSNVRAKGSIALYRGSSRNNSVPLTLILEPSEYICTGNTMRFFGNGSSEWVRVR